jgi:hypothetical protein
LHICQCGKHMLVVKGFGQGKLPPYQRHGSCVVAAGGYKVGVCTS